MRSNSANSAIVSRRCYQFAEHQLPTPRRMKPYQKWMSRPAPADCPDGNTWSAFVRRANFRQSIAAGRPVIQLANMSRLLVQVDCI
jgi:hypothetical protein